MDSIVSQRKNTLFKLLAINIALILFILVSVFGIKYLKSSILEYSNIKSDLFNGTVSPITYVPNWLVGKNTNKSLNFNSFTIDDFVELPKYDTNILGDTSGTDKNALLARYTYPVVYMGDYRLDYEEYAGSHPGIDIRAPSGTPVLAVANGVIVLVKNTETGDGKYVVIRHDNAKTINGTETIYSSYEHLSDIFVEEGTKISKGDVLGKVGMTGITTTPHLHFQIDKEVATFHPYWSYTFKEASDINLDFFSAVNAGLGKENAIAYTINPMEFVHDNLSKDETPLNSAPANDNVSPVSQNVETSKELVVSTSDNVVNEVKSDTGTTILTEVVSSGSEIITDNTGITQTQIVDNSTSGTIIDTTETITQTSNIVTGTSTQIFNDILVGSQYYVATKYLYDKNITVGFEDKTFKPLNTLTRRESLIFIFKLYDIKLDSNKLIPFSDIPKNDFIKPYLEKALDLGIISRNKKFRPNDTINRAEFVTILIKASGVIIQNTGNTGFDDVNATDWYAPYIETFYMQFTQSSKQRKFEPNGTFNRGQIAQILFLFSKNK